jgi:hypothetical protein
MRYNDVRHGTAVVEEVLAKYRVALKEKQMMSSGGLFVTAYLLRQSRTAPASDVGFTAW